MMQRAGIEVGIITGRTSEAVRIRAEELGIARVRQGTFDKVAAWREMLEESGVTPEESAYVGDDIVDIPLMRRAGVAAPGAGGGRKGDGETAVVPGGGRGPRGGLSGGPGLRTKLAPFPRRGRRDGGHRRAEDRPARSRDDRGEGGGAGLPAPLGRCPPCGAAGGRGR